MRRLISKIGRRDLQTAAIPPPMEKPIAPQKRCPTCFFNRKETRHSDGSTVVHCRNRDYRGGTYQSEHGNDDDECFYHVSDPPDYEKGQDKCLTCFHGTIWLPESSTYQCKLTTQLVLSASQCNQYANREEIELENAEHEALRLMHLTVKNTSIIDRVFRGQRFDGVDFDLLPWWEKCYRNFIACIYGSYPRPDRPGDHMI